MMWVALTLYISGAVITWILGSAAHDIIGLPADHKYPSKWDEWVGVILWPLLAVVFTVVVISRDKT